MANIWLVYSGGDADRDNSSNDDRGGGLIVRGDLGNDDENDDSHDGDNANDKDGDDYGADGGNDGDSGDGKDNGVGGANEELK